MLVRRLSTVVAGAAAAVLLSSAAASAHFCYFNNPNPNADSGRAGSKGFVSFGAIAASENICEAGAEYLADLLGISTDTLINAHGVMAGPTPGNKAISHLDFDVLLPAIPDAIALCEE